MKISFNKDAVYLEDYDVSIIPYLTDKQIKMIGDSIIARSNNYIDERNLLCAFVLLQCVDADEEELKALEFEDVLLSGFYDAIVSNIKNFDEIRKYIEWNKDYKRRVLPFIDVLSSKLKKVDWKKLFSRVDMSKIEKVKLDVEEETKKLLDRAGVNDTVEDEDAE